jgi:hypothetical protein
MYLRTTRRRNRDGSLTEYYQLAHNVRHADTGAPTAQIIHNFGRADELDREELARLCRSIARVCGLTVHDPVEVAEEVPSSGAGLPADLKLIRTVELGAPVVIEALWEQLGIGPVLRSACQDRRRKVPHERALLAMTANRLCAPESKLGVWDRWLKTVYMPSCLGLELRQMYDAMDVLHENIEGVERHIFATTSNLFNLDVDVIFYDTTSASFAIDEADPDDDETGEVGLRKLGHSKEGTWTPQVVIALAVTRDGIPVRSWVFPGNTADVTTVEKVKADLKDWKLGRALFVADAGMNSEENRKTLAQACGKYLLACRVGSVSEIKEDVLSRPGRYKEVADNLHVKEVTVGDGVRENRYLVCINPDEAKRQAAHRKLVIEELENELAGHPDHEALAQWAAKLRASRRYGRYVRVTEKGQIQIDHGAAREAERYDGKWVIETNDDTLTPEDAAKGYKALLVIERCFRSLKRTQIKLTPMFHWVPRRIETHVKICVLALLIERVIERKCGRPWSRIRTELRELQASSFQTATHEFYQRNEPPKSVGSVLTTLAIPFPKRILGVSPL